MYGIGLFMSSQCVALDACPDNPKKRYHECFGMKQDRSAKSKYIGSFINNQFHGHGLRIWPDGRQYAGEFKEGVRHGQGTEIWPNGNKYIGQYHNGVIVMDMGFTCGQMEESTWVTSRKTRKMGLEL